MTENIRRRTTNEADEQRGAPTPQTHGRRAARTQTLVAGHHNGGGRAAPRCWSGCTRARPLGRNRVLVLEVVVAHEAIELELDAPPSSPS